MMYLGLSETSHTSDDIDDVAKFVKDIGIN